MFCEQCGKQIESGSAFCQECGWKVPAETEAAEEVTEAASEEKTEAVEAAEEMADANKAETAGNAANTAPASENSVWATTTPASAPVDSAAPKAKKKSGWKAAGIALGIVAVLAVVGVVVYPKISNFAAATFSEPEEYYAHVEKNQVSELMEDYEEGYEASMDAVASYNDLKSEANITLEIGEPLHEIITEILEYEGIEVEIDWLKSINIGAAVNMKEDAAKLEAKFGANNENIISGNMIIDFEEEGIYLQSPELNKKYLMISFDDFFEAADMDEEMLEEMSTVFGIYETLPQYLPESKEVSELLEKYVLIALEQMDNVEKDKDTLKVDGISQKCNVLEVTIDTETVQNVVTALLEEVVKDEKLEEMVVKLVSFYEDMPEEFLEEMGIAEIDAQEAYDALIAAAENALENVENNVDMGDHEILMTVYVDNDGKVIGREIEMEGKVFRYAKVQKGSEFAMECCIENEALERKAGIEGNGTIKGNKLNGEFSVVVEDGKESAEFVCIIVEDLIASDMAKGEISGKFTITLGEDLLAAAVESLEEEGLDDLEYEMVSKLLEAAIELEVKCTKNSNMMSIAILDPKEMLIRLTLEDKIGSADKISTPKESDTYDMLDEDDLIEWAAESDWDALLKTLEDKVEVPGDYMDVLEDAVDSMLDEIE